MSRIAPLEAGRAAWDKYRGAVVIPSGVNVVAISLEALESWVNRSLSPDEAVEAAVGEQAVIRAVANTISAQDNVIMITTNIMNSRSWDAEPHEEQSGDMV